MKPNQPASHSTARQSPVSFYLRVLAPKPGFPSRSFIVSDGSTVEAVRGTAEMKHAKRYADGAQAMEAQSRCESAGCAVSIVAANEG